MLDYLTPKLIANAVQVACPRDRFPTPEEIRDLADKITNALQVPEMRNSVYDEVIRRISKIP